MESSSEESSSEESSYGYVVCELSISDKPIKENTVSNTKKIRKLKKQRKELRERVASLKLSLLRVHILLSKL